MEPKDVMIIGGGIAGMTAAWKLAESGVNVHLIEKSGFLGGHAIQYTCKATSECLQCGACSVEKMLKNVMETDNIKLHLSTEITSVEKSNKYFGTKRWERRHHHQQPEHHQRKLGSCLKLQLAMKIQNEIENLPKSRLLYYEICTK